VSGRRRECVGAESESIWQILYLQTVEFASVCSAVFRALSPACVCVFILLSVNSLRYMLHFARFPSLPLSLSLSFVPTPTVIRLIVLFLLTRPCLRRLDADKTLSFGHPRVLSALLKILTLQLRYYPYVQLTVHLSHK